MIERKIKELSIALEALSRVQGTDTYSAQISSLLQHQIDEANKENHPLKPVHPSTSDDDIPF